MLDPARRVVALLLPEDADRFTFESSEAADDRLVLAEIAVAGEGRELGDEALDVVAEARTALDARDLGLLPGRQVGVEIGQRLVGAGLEPGDFLGEGGRVALLCDRAQLVQAGVDFGDRRFEAEIGAHSILAANRPRRGGARKLAAGRGEVKRPRGLLRVPSLASALAMRQKGEA